MDSARILNRSPVRWLRRSSSVNSPMIVVTISIMSLAESSPSASHVPQLVPPRHGSTPMTQSGRSRPLSMPSTCIAVGPRAKDRHRNSVVPPLISLRRRSFRGISLVRRSAFAPLWRWAPRPRERRWWAGPTEFGALLKGRGRRGSLRDQHLPRSRRHLSVHGPEFRRATKLTGPHAFHVSM
jgi:hypothetical protein